jgi:hypothetical protein
MSGDDATILDRIREFERTFEERYCRKMTDAERRTLETAKELIQQRQGTKHSEKAAT